MESVILRPLFHRGQDCIGIYFPMNKELQSIVQKKAGAAWSRTQKCWYIALTEENYKKLRVALKGKSGLEVNELREFLLKRKGDQAVPQPKVETRCLASPTITTSKGAKHPSPTITTSRDAKHRISTKTEREKHQSPKETPVLCRENIEALQRFQQLLQLKSYSPSTIRTYTNEFVQFLNKLGNVPAEQMTVNRLKDYLEYCHRVLRLSENTLHSRINALKFYYEQVLHREKFFWEIPRPKKPLQLPKVISKEKIAGLINSIENVKHKTIIMLAYACGLRVSEVVSLKVNHIDGQRKILLIQQSKGKKDRVVSLSPNMLIMLREYYKQYKPAHYLFEGQNKNEHLTSRSIQNVLYKAKEKAGIKQEGGMHMLRHSFATHLLDKGIDVVFIQKLLGHNDIKTTLKYLHVTNKDLVHILSPLEDIEALLKK